MSKRTKIVATVGPSTSSEEVLTAHSVVVEQLKSKENLIF